MPDSAALLGDNSRLRCEPLIVERSYAVTNQFDVDWVFTLEHFHPTVHVRTDEFRCSTFALMDNLLSDVILNNAGTDASVK